MRTTLDVARDLSTIQQLTELLADQATHHANDREVPGGDAMVALAPVASLEAWEYQFEAREARGLSTAHVIDEDDSWEPPLQTLLFWSERWRTVHNRESDRRPTVESESEFIRRILDWVQENEAEWEEFASDIHKARARLENVVMAGDRNKYGVKCFSCDRALVRVSRPRRLFNYCKGIGGVCRWPHRYCPHDWGGLSDTWHCPSCQRKYTDEDYTRAVQQAHFVHADYLPVDACAERTGVRAGTIRVWAARGKVRKVRETATARMTYNVRDVCALVESL